MVAARLFVVVMTDIVNSERVFSISQGEAIAWATAIADIVDSEEADTLFLKLSE